MTAAVLLGVGMTFAASKFLSATILRGQPSGFTLELPPYRKPQFGKVIVRSLLDRTLFVLGRAAAVAAPAGAVIWILANVTVDGSSLLSYCTGALDPFAKLLGMDGVILMAFILGLPANEIVIPIIIMCYMSQGSLTELSLPALAQLLGENGWTWRTAVCTDAVFAHALAVLDLAADRQEGSRRLEVGAGGVPAAYLRGSYRVPRSRADIGAVCGLMCGKL